VTEDAPARAPLVRRAPTSASDKLRRGLWSAAWLILCRWTPRPLHGWRALVLRMFGARVAAGARVYPDARIWAPWLLEMAAGSTLGDGVECYNVDWVRLGPDATVSQRAFLCTATPARRGTARQLYELEPRFRAALERTAPRALVIARSRADLALAVPRSGSTRCSCSAAM